MCSVPRYNPTNRNEVWGPNPCEGKDRKESISTCGSPVPELGICVPVRTQISRLDVCTTDDRHEYNHTRLLKVRRQPYFSQCAPLKKKKGVSCRQLVLCPIYSFTEPLTHVWTKICVHSVRDLGRVSRTFFLVSGTTQDHSTTLVTRLHKTHTHRRPTSPRAVKSNIKILTFCYKRESLIFEFYRTWVYCVVNIHDGKSQFLREGCRLLMTLVQDCKRKIQKVIPWYLQGKW